MSESKTDNSKQLTLGKLLLIVGLVKALIIVLFLQFRSNDISQGFNTYSRLPGTHTMRTRRKPAVPNKPTPAVSLRTTTWPIMGLRQASAFDPFGVPKTIASKANPPAASPDTDLVQTEPTLPESEGPSPLPPDPLESAEAHRLRSLGVSAIIARGGERIALIGSEEIRVGDRLGGFRVTAIGDAGVELEVDPFDALPAVEDSESEIDTRDNSTLPTATGAIQ